MLMLMLNVVATVFISPTVEAEEKAPPHPHHQMNQAGKTAPSIMTEYDKLPTGDKEIPLGINVASAFCGREPRRERVSV